jgi:hypothetical protein
MKKNVITIEAFTTIFFVLIVITIAGCIRDNGNIGQISIHIDTHHDQIGNLPKNNPDAANNLKMVDTLDNVVFSKKEWIQLHEDHAQDIKVYWPDGHITKGIEKHIEDIKAMFLFAPDVRIKQLPVNVGSGNMTIISEIFEGTFTKPMPIGNGKFIQPTGKAFKIPVCSIGIWNQDGSLSEEHMFWDNNSIMNEIGLRK